MKKYLDRFGYFKQAIILDEIDPHSDMIVVIPAYDEPRLTLALESITAAHVEYSVCLEVIVVVNYPEYAGAEVKERIDTQLDFLQSYIDLNGRFPIHTIKAFDLPKKKAGVGLARKIGMDEAAIRLLNTESGDGIICCYDADCTSDPNYFKAIENTFYGNDIHATSIKFSHPLMPSDPNLASIILYELHLRLYLQFQRDIGLPFAYHTVGSSMAVRASKYISLGGMNTRKAGEDFYFLQKFIAQGYCVDCNATTVYPSTRVSARVPFGTGRAMGELLDTEDLKYHTYNPDSYAIFYPLLKRLEMIYEGAESWRVGLHDELLNYLQITNFDEKIDELKSNVSTFSSFKKRFFQRFDAFWFMKYLHHMRDQGFSDLDVLKVASVYLECEEVSPEGLLLKMRKRNMMSWESV